MKDLKALIIVTIIVLIADSVSEFFGNYGSQILAVSLCGYSGLILHRAIKAKRSNR